jgi:transposase-like protein
MKHTVRKAVNYTSSYKRFIVNAVMRDGISIASICTQQGIDEPYQVREWVRAEMKKRDLVRIPRTLLKRGKAPKVCISEPVNRQFERYEEILIYQECLIESLLLHIDKDAKKKVFAMLSPAQRRDLKRREKKLT